MSKKQSVEEGILAGLREAVEFERGELPNVSFALAVASAVRTHGIQRVAALLRVSPASITRYAQGKNAPHPLMRETFCGALASLPERPDESPPSIVPQP
jgi:hypothetical protein